MMYDIHFILPISACRPEYAVRIPDFKNYGLLNVKDKKCLVTFLVGTETLECNGGWREKVDVEIVPSVFDDAAQKVYDYLAEAKCKARWTAKIDDDSVTDVSNLVDNLDANFGDANLYLCANLNREEPGQMNIEKKILDELGIAWHRNKQPVWHEIEASVVSSRAFNSIASSQVAQQFLKKRAFVKGGVTDIAWAIAARLAGVAIVDCYYLSRYPLVGNFSFFGGGLNHIHLIKRHAFGFSDRSNNNALEFIEKRLNNTSKHVQDLTNQEYLLSVPGRLIAIVKFDESGKVDGATHPNESVWMIDDNKLKIYNHEGNATSEYPLTNLNKLQGRFLQNDSVMMLQKLAT